MKKSAVYFDLDGVLFDWVSMYNSVYGNKMSLSEFNTISKEEKKVIKNEIFGYDFFRKMNVIEHGRDLLMKYLNDDSFDVFICSAVGDSDHIELIEVAKREAVKEHFGDIKCFFVNKVEYKHTMMQQGYDNHILIDDREKAIDAWNANGGIGILFV